MPGSLEHMLIQAYADEEQQRLTHGNRPHHPGKESRHHGGKRETFHFLRFFQASSNACAICMRRLGALSMGSGSGAGTQSTMEPG